MRWLYLLQVVMIFKQEKPFVPPDVSSSPGSNEDVKEPKKPVKKAQVWKFSLYSCGDDALFHW